MKSMRKHKGQLATTQQYNRIRVYVHSPFKGNRNNRPNILGDNDLMLLIGGTPDGDYVVLTQLGLRYVAASDMIVLRWITC